MKKVIFVGGTSYSGSTFLDMILSNDQKGFSCGEVVALFNPYRKHHINPECGCGEKHCEFWQKVLEGGKKKLYQTIYELMPDIEFIVDSSKDPQWIASQTKNLQVQNLKVKNILIWKTPIEFGKSLIKRNRIKELEKSWINYHRLYFTLVNNWKSIRYYDLTNNPMYLKDLCEYLEIQYFHGKEKYWEKKHHTLFGNTSAKIHLYPDNTQLFEKARDELLKQPTLKSSQIEDKLQTLYYEKPSKDLEKYIGEIISLNRYFTLIENQLASKDLLKDDQKVRLYNQKLSELRYNKILILLRILKNTLINHKNRRNLSKQT